MNTLKKIADKHETVFTQIYRSKKWGGKDADSVSGPGSDIRQTAVITKEFPSIFSNFSISTMLDVPCGDFHWMKNVDLSAIDYTGADIVDALIGKNTEQFINSNRRFKKLNIIEDKLPKLDLVFCRDCLVHFSFADIFHALHNICNSQSEYLLTTTFTERENNRDIETGKWRPLNLERAPFMLPKPLYKLNEGCTEAGGAFKDKTLCLWRISDIHETLTKMDWSSSALT
jgi:hypothetical protein